MLLQSITILRKYVYVIRIFIYRQNMIDSNIVYIFPHFYIHINAEIFDTSPNPAANYHIQPET